MFWLLAALLTLLATATIVWPLLRRGAEASVAGDRAAHDREVFRAQLRELGQDAERGAIASGDALAARAEIGRRMIRSQDARPAPATSMRGPAIAALVVALFLPLGAFLFYDRTGAPEIADQPLASRDLSREQPSVAAVVALIERRLAERPDDAEGWSVVAPVYLRMGEGTKAAHAYREALRLGRDTAEVRAGLGEALVQTSGGEITAEARESFRRALAAEPGLPAARFYLALDLSRQGRLAEAAPAWASLLAETPAEVPWRPVAEAALREARGDATPPAPGPTASDVDAAAALAPADRTAMIEGMVAQLASRLETAPDDAEGWARLMRSYLVLGDRERAGAALQRALQVFPDGSAGRMRVLDAAVALGLPASPDTRTP